MTSVVRVAVQSFFQLLHPLFLGYWPIEAISVAQPLFSMLVKDTARGEDNGENEFENDEFDEDYFDDDIKADGTQASAVTRWAAYWAIPLVKFVNHALLKLLAIIILIATLLDPSQGLQRDPVRGFTTPDGMPPQEWLFWIISLGRIAEEVGQVLKCSSLRTYMSSLWNQLDVLIIMLNITAYILRVIVINYPDLEPGDKAAYRTLYDTQALYMDVHLWGLLVFIVRYLEFLAYNGPLGEVRSPPASLCPTRCAPLGWTHVLECALTAASFILLGGAGLLDAQRDDCR